MLEKEKKKKQITLSGHKIHEIPETLKAFYGKHSIGDQSIKHTLFLSANRIP